MKVKSWFRSLKIRYQFQVIVGLLVVSIFAISGIVHYNSVKDSVYNRYREREVLMVMLKAAQGSLQSSLERAIETSEMLADDPMLIDWFKNYEIDVNYKRLILEKLNKLHDNFGYSSVFAVNIKTHNYWCEGYKKLDVVSESDPDDSWFFNAIKSPEEMEFNIDYNKELGKTMLFVNVLMLDEEEVIGVSGVGVDPWLLISEFEKHKPTENTCLWLIDRKGKILLSSNIEEINSSLNNFLPKQSFQTILQNNQNNSLTDQLDNGREVELAYMSLTNNNKYKVVMLTPMSELFPVLNMIKRQTFWFAIIFLFITLLVVAFLAKKISIPLQKLQKMSLQFAKGNFNEKADASLYERNDELGQLARTFDSMQMQLSHYIDRLNSANSELQEEKKQLKVLNDQLSDALYKASESERLTQSFLANISHEIRTPMNSILGFSQLLEHPEINQEDKVLYASHVVKGGQQLLSILDSIINLSKFESGVVAPKFEIINIQELLKDTVDLYKVMADQKSIEMSLDLNYSKEDLFLESDPALLQLVLNNLISNAIKYTEIGFVKLGYKKRGSKIEFFVSDSGIGISDKDLDVVFKPFRQVNLSQTMGSGGAGLGLAIVSKVLQILGGKVRVLSELNKGSTFYVEMPLKSEKRADK